MEEGFRTTGWQVPLAKVSTGFFSFLPVTPQFCLATKYSKKVRTADAASGERIVLTVRATVTVFAAA